MDITSFVLGYQKGKASGGGSGGGGSSDVRYVTFMSYDGSVEYGKKAVAVGDDCADPIARGIFDTPTRESTAQYDFSFVGWATTPNGAWDESALDAVTEDRTVYAAYASAVRSYTVSFYDGDTWLVDKTVVYGGSTTYEPPAKDGYFFDKWEPAPENVTGNMSCYAQYKIDIDFGTASWADIAAVSESGEAESYFALGDSKQISFAYNGTTYSVDVEIVAFNYDSKADGSGTAGITVCAKNPSSWQTPKHSSNTPPDCNWPNCDLRATLQSEIYNSLDDGLKAVIKPVTKKTTGYSGSAATTYTTIDTLWLPALGEINSSDVTNYSLIREDVALFSHYTLVKDNAYYLRTGLNVAKGTYGTGVVTTANPYIRAGSCAGGVNILFGFCI